MSDDFSGSPFAALFAELGGVLGIEGLAPEADGVCRLVFNHNRLVELWLSPAQGRLLLTCRLAAPLAAGGEPARVLLRGSHLGAGLGGGWFGLDAHERPVLHAAFPLADASGALLLTAIERLLDHADTWERRLDEQANQAATQDTSALDRMTGFMNRI